MNDVRVGDIYIRKDDKLDYVVSNIDYNQIYLIHIKDEKSKRINGIVILKKDLDNLFTRKGENKNGK